MSDDIIMGGVRHLSQNKLTLTLQDELFEQVKSEAGKKAMPVATWIRSVLADYLQNRVSDTDSVSIG